MLPETNDFCRLILLRHPELDPGYANLAIGAGEAPIGRRGQAQVLAWFEQLASTAIDSVHCSEQPQCMEPARALGAHKKVDVVPDPRLRDQEMGLWQGRVWDELVQEDGPSVHEFFANFGEGKAPEGESLGQAVERMYAWWSDITPDSLRKTRVAVASGAMISGFATALLGMRLSRCVSLSLPHGGIGILDCFANGARITSWNPHALGH